METRPADAERERGRDALFADDSDRTGAESERGEIVALVRTRWPATTGRQKEEVRALLIGVTKETPMAFSPMVRLELIHPATLGQAVISCLNILRNYN